MSSLHINLSSEQHVTDSLTLAPSVTLLSLVQVPPGTKEIQYLITTEVTG
jgi:hypothetical protein